MYQSEVAPLKRVLMKHPADAFVSQQRIAEQWQALSYTGQPDYDGACREADALAALLGRLGATVDWMPADDIGLDSVYARDASLVSNAGAILARMGKGARSAVEDADRIAGMGLTTNWLIADKPEPEAAMPGMPPGGMPGGMPPM